MKSKQQLALIPALLITSHVQCPAVTYAKFILCMHRYKQPNLCRHHEPVSFCIQCLSVGMLQRFTPTSWRNVFIHHVQIFKILSCAFRLSTASEKEKKPNKNLLIRHQEILERKKSCSSCGHAGGAHLDYLSRQFL